MAHILILEDDASLNRGISLTLSREGYAVDAAGSIAEAEVFLERGSYELVLCDITLPDGSGLEFGQKVRQTTGSYLIYLTALDAETDIVTGYEPGADDYITKPFSLMVLVSKVAALLRRMEETGGDRLCCGEIIFSRKEMNVKKAGQPVALSKRELQLLLYLMEHAGRVVTKENIMEHIWEQDGQFLDENTVPVNISRLKNKLGTEAIVNVRGLGYLWTGNVERR